MKKPILVVMAAGLGSRYGGLKQIDPVGNYGQLIIDYSIYDARRAGFETVVFIITRNIEREFCEAIGDRMERFMEVRYAFQALDVLPKGFSVPQKRKKPWGTCHAILCAKDVIDAPFAVINADDYYGPAAFKEIYNALDMQKDSSDRYEFSMVGYLLKNTVTDAGHVARGVCAVNAQGYLESVTERTRIETYDGGIHYTQDDGKNWTDLSGDTVVSMNLWGFDTGFVKEAEERFGSFLNQNLDGNPLKAEYFLPSVVSGLVSEGKARVKVLSSPDKWYGVTYRADKPAVVEAVAQKTAAGFYPDMLWGDR